MTAPSQFPVLAPEHVRAGNTDIYLCDAPSAQPAWIYREDAEANGWVTDFLGRRYCHFHAARARRPDGTYDWERCLPLPGDTAPPEELYERFADDPQGVFAELDRHFERRACDVVTLDDERSDAVAADDPQSPDAPHDVREFDQAPAAPSEVAHEDEPGEPWDGTLSDAQEGRLTALLGPLPDGGEEFWEAAS